MKQAWNITIGRQSGSGGHAVGLALAEKLGQPFYDRELLFRVVQESGLNEQLVKSMDEKPRSFLYSLAMDPVSFRSGSFLHSTPVEQQVYLATFDTIRKLGKEEPGVFVGRCADHVLKDLPHVLRVFLYAPLPWRMAQVQEREGISSEEARLSIQRTDKRRAAYYNAYAAYHWGDINGYDLCIDTSLLGVDGTVDLILEVLRRKEAE